MRVERTDVPLAEAEADLVCVGLFEDEELPPPLAGAPGATEARGSRKAASLVYPGAPERALVVGLGKRADFDPEAARVAAAVSVREAGRQRAAEIAWLTPDQGEPDAIAAALVEGAVLAAYRFVRLKSAPAEDATPVEAVRILPPPSGDGAVTQARLEAARVGAEAANRARELQDLPGNVATPELLADRAREIAAADARTSAEVLGPAEIEALGMGGLLAISAGAAAEPRLIALRYDGGGRGLVGLVGKAVTFDSGGISIKPSASMHEMKMDMSGGAAVLEAVAAIAELGTPVNLLAVVPATENMPSGTAVRPGDVITQHNGKTVEVNNTDAEGRLILADALSWCVDQGADRIVDLATLTGAVVVALGSTYAALISNDDGWAERVRAAGDASGELAWRLPLHPEYKELVKGTVADLVNVAPKRKAGTIYAASFLEEFVGDRPWAHLDIAGTAWDTGREYVGGGATGFGTRLLVTLVRDLAGSS